MTRYSPWMWALYGSIAFGLGVLYSQIQDVML